MTLETNLTLIFWNTLSGVIVNSPWLILFYLGFRMIAKELKEGIKHIPSWIEQYNQIKMAHYQIERARGMR